MNPSTAAQFFSLNSEELCILERWDADGLELHPGVEIPSFGRHGGPLIAESTPQQVKLTRWAPGAAGKLEPTVTTTALTGLPSDAFIAGYAVDFDSAAGRACASVPVTAIAWTSGSDFFNVGELLTLGPSSVETATATGVFGMAAIDGRLFYTGLSAIEGPTNGELALYGAASDECAATLTSAGVAEAEFGLAAGPVTADLDGNLFAIMTDYVLNTQTIHGYRAESVGGTLPLDAVELATFAGYGDAFAALPPSASKPGLLVLQPSDASNVHQDVVAVEYTTAGGSLQAGTTSTLLTLSEPDTNLTLFSDDAGRIWVGATSTGETPVTTFFVLGRP